MLSDAEHVNLKNFTHRRSLPLRELVTNLLNLCTGGNQDELDRFFEVVSGQHAIQCITLSAVCQARLRIKPRAFIALNDKLREGFYRYLGARCWCGLRLLSVNGFTARLPLTVGAEETFGSSPEGSAVTLARWSRLYEVLNQLVVEADI